MTIEDQNSAVFKIKKKMLEKRKDIELKDLQIYDLRSKLNV